MRSSKFVFISAFLFLAACATNRTGSSSSSDYVEIDNPGFTMSPNAPAKIWVPRSYVDSGVPRGSELVKEGVAKVTGKVEGSPKSNMEASAPEPVKQNIIVFEVGENGLTTPLKTALAGTVNGVFLDPAQAGILARSTSIENQADRMAFVKKLGKESGGVNVAIFLSAAEGVAPGKPVVAEVYDAMGGGLLRMYDTVLPHFDAADLQGRKSAVAAATGVLAGKISDIVTMLPWYGRIASVENGRVYIDAGREAGLKIGQILKVYRSGKFVEGLGFAPGPRNGSVEVSGFVGPNGSFALMKDAKEVRAGDVVSIE